MNCPVFFFACGLAFHIAAAPGSSGKTLHVPRDHSSIQAAIDASTEGDRIVVAAGTYRERVQLKAGITLSSAGGDGSGEQGLQRAEATIIDGAVDGATGAGVTMAEGSVIDGFTVTGVGDYDEERWQRHWDERGENQAHEHIGGFGSPGIGADDTRRYLGLVDDALTVYA